MRALRPPPASPLVLAICLASATALADPHGKPQQRAPTTVHGEGGNVTIIVQTAPANSQTSSSPPVERAARSDEAAAPNKTDGSKRDGRLAAAERNKGPRADEAAIERARRGVVTIERAGEVVGLGTVLANDGRVVTALSPLGDGNNLDLRYADGTLSPAKVGHSSRTWDLAMLVPAAGKWPEGLRAAESDPTITTAKLSSFFAQRSGKVTPTTTALKGRRAFLGADATPLANVFELGSRVGPHELGGPVVDEHGDVVAVLGRACAPVAKGPCLPTPVGVPVHALRGFFAKAPPSALQPMQPPPWLGVQGVTEKSPVPGVRVTGVAPDSPAEQGGIKAPIDRSQGDLIVAVDDQPVTSPEALSKLIAPKAPGDRVKLLLLNDNRFRESVVSLGAAPPRR